MYVCMYIYIYIYTYVGTTLMSSVTYTTRLKQYSDYVKPLRSSTPMCVSMICEQESHSTARISWYANCDADWVCIYGRGDEGRREQHVPCREAACSSAGSQYDIMQMIIRSASHYIVRHLTIPCSQNLSQMSHAVIVILHKKVYRWITQASSRRCLTGAERQHHLQEDFAYCINMLP